MLGAACSSWSRGGIGESLSYSLIPAGSCSRKMKGLPAVCELLFASQGATTASAAGRMRRAARLAGDRAAGGTWGVGPGQEEAGTGM